MAAENVALHHKE